MKIYQIAPTLNNLSPRANKTQTFAGLNTKAISETVTKKESKLFDPLKKAYHAIMDPVVNVIEKGFTKLIDSKPAEKIVKGTLNHEWIKNKLFSHLIVFGSTILSGFYVIKTLSNKKLDEKRRRTLAINQAFVYALSTLGAYTIDSKLNKKIDQVTQNYKKYNNALSKEILGKHVKGIGRAKSIIVIDTMYRFIAPVIVTPFANWVGNKLIEREEKTQDALKKTNK